MKYFLFKQYFNISPKMLELPAPFLPGPSLRNWLRTEVVNNNWCYRSTTEGFVRISRHPFVTTTCRANCLEDHTWSCNTASVFMCSFWAKVFVKQFETEISGRLSCEFSGAEKVNFLFGAFWLFCFYFFSRKISYHK